MYQLHTINIHGCVLGLANEQGVRIKKPWTIAVHGGYIRDAFLNKACRGTAMHPAHQKTGQVY